MIAENSIYKLNFQFFTWIYIVIKFILEAELRKKEKLLIGVAFFMKETAFRLTIKLA
jgi:hypothetical protein